jgi:transglutaminase-like putative cysteine protease
MIRDRTAAPLAALATTLTLWSLAPVVEGSDWQGPVLAMIVVVLVVGIGARAAGAPGPFVLPAQLAAGLVVLTALFAGDAAVAGLLPGPAAATELGELLAEGGRTVSRYAAPVPISGGVSLILALGVLGVAALVDLAAVTLRAPAAAGLPLLALYCVPAAVLPDGLSSQYFVVAAAGWLLLLAHDAGAKVSGWGRLLPRWAGTTSAPSRNILTSDASAQAATGRRLGVAAIAVAVAVPALTPGLADGLLTAGGSTGLARGSGGLTVINPVLTLRDSLDPREDVVVLRYQTNQTDVAPLRIVTADDFDGESWRPGTRDVTRRNRVASGLPAAPGLTSAIPRSPYSMRVEIGPNLNQDFLPLPYPTTQIDIRGNWLFDSTSLNVIGDGETVRDKTYDVRYLAVRPTADQLSGAPPANPPGPPDAYTRLPGNLPESVRRTAVRVTRGSANRYEQALALQEWFRTSGRFTYSIDAPDGSDGDAVATFLRERRGYCVQFSSAMAVMARSLGIPARIGVGFLPGSPEEAGWRSVRLTDAHAWPELYFGGAGWVRFEPTPASRTGTAPGYARPRPAAGPSTAGPTSTTSRPSSTASAEADAQVRALQEAEERQRRSATVGTSIIATGTVARTWVKWVGLALLMLAAVLISPATAWLGRRRRRASARDDPAAVEASWADLLERVDDLGVSLGSGLTPRQVGAGLGVAGGLTADPRSALARVTRAVEHSRYARPSVAWPDIDPTSVREDVHTVVSTVRRSRPRGARVRAAIWPRSGSSRLWGAGARVGRRLAAWDRWTAASAHRISRLRIRRPRVQRR